MKTLQSCNTAGAEIVRKQHGFSLIELMVALVLGLIIVAALSEIFVDISRSNQEMANTNAQIENARFAMQFLESDIVHAGFWAGFIPEYDDLTLPGVPSDEPTLVPDPCLVYTSWAGTLGYIDALMGIPLQTFAHDDIPTACGSAPVVIANVEPETDILVVRHANTCVPGDANCEADVAGKLYFQASNCQAEIESSPSQGYALDPNSFLLTERDCTTAAAKRKFIQHIYYIRDFALTSGDGIPTLVRSEFDVSGGTPAHITPVVPLVEGIERFRVELGVDSISDTGALVNYAQAVVWADPDVYDSATNRGDGVPDPNAPNGGYVHCTQALPCTSAQLRDVVAVKLYLLARAIEPTPGYTDGKTYQLGSGATFTPASESLPTDVKRHVFSTNIRLNNIAGRRETP